MARRRADSAPSTVWLDGVNRGMQRQMAVGLTAVVNGVNCLNLQYHPHYPGRQRDHGRPQLLAERAQLPQCRQHRCALHTWFGAYSASR